MGSKEFTKELSLDGEDRLRVKIEIGNGIKKDLEGE